MPIDENASVYVLYAGKDPKIKKAVDEIKIMLEGKGIEGFDYQDREVVDKPDRTKKHDTMDKLYESIGNGRVIVMHIDEHYLNSKFCIHEISIIINKSPNKEHIKERVIPIVHNKKIIDKLYNKKEHKNLRKIVENTIEKYIKDNKAILDDDEIKILETYPKDVEDFFKILSEIRYQSIEYNDDEETRKNIDNKLSAKTIDLQKFLKEERERIENEVKANKITIELIPKIFYLVIFISIAVVVSFLFLASGQKDLKNGIKEVNKTTHGIEKTVKDTNAIEYKHIAISQNMYKNQIQNEIKSSGEREKHHHEEMELLKKISSSNVSQEKYTTLDLKSFNNEVSIKLSQAEEYIKNKNYIKAIKIYDNLLENDKKLTENNRVKLYKQRILVYAKKKDWNSVNEASTLYIAYIKDKLEDKQYIIGMALAKKYMGKANYYLGEYSLARQMFFEAEKYYKKYYGKTNINMLWMRNWITSTFEEAKQYKEEKKFLEESLPFVRKLEQDNNLTNRLEFPFFYAHLGYVNDVLEKKDSAIKYYEIALKGHDKINSKKDNDWIYRNIANVCKSKKEYNKTVNYYKKSLNIYSDNKNYSAMANIYWNLYDTYFSMDKRYLKNAENALKNSRKYYSKANKKENTKKYDINIAKTYCNLGWFYSHKGNYPEDKIVNSYTKCINLKKQLDSKEHLIDVVWSQRDLADYFFNKQDYDDAEKYYRDALKNIEIVVNEYNQTQYAKELAWTYHDIGASIDGKTEGFEGLPYFEKALQTYEKFEISNSSYITTLNALQYIFQQKFDNQELYTIGKKLLEYYENKDDNVSWDKAFQSYIIGTSKKNKDSIYYLDKSLEMFKKIKGQNKFYAEFIPAVLIAKTQYYLDNNLKENATKVFNELKKYKISKDLKAYYKFLSKTIEGNISIDDTSDLMKDQNEPEMIQILNLEKRCNVLDNQKNYIQKVALYRQIYRLATKGFKKRVDVYSSVLSGVATDMINLNINEKWNNELKEAITLLKEKELDDTVEMADLLLVRVRYELHRNIFGDKNQLTGALKIYKKHNVNHKYDFQICYVYFTLGRYYHLLHNYKQAEKYYQKVLDFKTTTNIRGLKIPTLENLVGLHLKQGYYSLAITKGLEAIEEYRKTKNIQKKEDYEYGLKKLYSAILPLYLKTSDIKGFYSLYDEMNKNTKSVMERWEEEALMETDTLVETFKETQQYNEAIEFLLKVFKKYEYIRDNEDFQVKVGDLYEKVNKIDKAKEHYKIATLLYLDTIKNMKQDNEEQVYIDLAYKELSELKKCIKSKDICNRKDYVICKIEENNVSKLEITLDKECKNDISEECTIITQNEWNKILYDAEVNNNNEFFEKYGTDEDVNMSGAVEPIR